MGSDSDSSADAGLALGGAGGGRRKGRKSLGVDEALQLLGGADSGSDAEGETGASARKAKMKKALKKKREAASEKKPKKPSGAAALKAKLMEEEGAPQGEVGEQEQQEARAKKPKRSKKAKEDGAALDEGAEGAEPKRRRRKKEKELGMEDLFGSEEAGEDPQQAGAGAGVKKGRQARGGGGGGGRGGKESESELEVGEDEEREWSADLASRVDSSASGAGAGSSDLGLRTAFSMKEFPASAIRRLGAECLLGKRKLEEGGKLLFDEDGKANLHYLLGTYAEVTRAQQRSSEPVLGGESELRYLRWLIRKARSLRVVSKAEVKRGKVLLKRLANAKKQGTISLALECNLVNVKDREEGAEGEALAEAAGSAEMRFPERRPVATAQTSTASSQRLRSHVVTRQKSVIATKSHDMDLQKAREILQAPSLSFDWDHKDEEDEFALEVDVPELSKAPDSRRNLFREQLHRSISANQAKNLARLERTGSGLARAPSNRSLGGASEEQPPAQASSAGGSKVRPAPGRAPAPAPAPAPAGSAASRPAAEAEPEVTHESVKEVAKESMTATKGEVASSASSAAPAPGTEEETAAPGVDSEVAPKVLCSESQDNAVGALSKVESVAAEARAEPTSPTESALFGSQIAQTQASVIGSLDEISTQAFQALATGAGQLGAAQDQSSTQDWPDDMSPTNMWAAGAFSIDKTSSVAEKPGVQAQAQVHAEISPTFPFDVAAWMEKTTAQEISPTVPFVPVGFGDCGDGDRRGDAAMEISPTMPFVCPVIPAEPAPPEVSPTLPFDPSEVLKIAAAANYAAAANCGTSNDRAHRSGDAGRADVSAAVEGSTVTTADGLMAMDPPLDGHISEDESSIEEDPETAEDPEVCRAEASGEAGKRKREEDKKWKREQRRRLQEEEGRRRQQELKVARDRRRSAEAAHGLGRATMSREDLSRYEAVLDVGTGRTQHCLAHTSSGTLAAAIPQEQSGFGLRPLSGSGSNKSVGDDADLFGGFRQGGVQRPKFLMGRSAAATA